MSRQQVIKFRVTDDERDEITTLSENASMSVSDYIRNRVLNKPVHNRSNDQIVREVRLLYQAVRESRIESDILMSKLESLIVLLSQA